MSDARVAEILSARVSDLTLTRSALISTYPQRFMNSQWIAICVQINLSFAQIQKDAITF